MGKSVLFGGSGLLGSTFLEMCPDLISVGRTRPSSHIPNSHIHMSNTDYLSVLDDMEIDNVIFLIGNSNHHTLNTSPLGVALDFNVNPMADALDYFHRKHKLKSFVFFTTILLYGNDSKGRPVNETDTVYPHANNYIFSKHIAEELGRYYASKGMPIINCRISNIYSATTLARPDLVPSLVKDAITKDMPEVWSTLPIRDWLYCKDAVNAVLGLIEQGFLGTINLGTGKSHSVGTICAIISKLSGKNICTQNKEVTGVMEFTTDTTLLMSILDKSEKYNEFPKYTLEQGLIETFNVMKEHIENQNIIKGVNGTN